MTHRIERLEAALCEAIRTVLTRGLSDPRVEGMVTITGVRVLPDLSAAVVSVSVFPEEKETLTFHGIESSAGYIRKEAGKLVETRQVPVLRFELDRSIKKQAQVLRAIDRAKEDLERRESSRSEQP